MAGIRGIKNPMPMSGGKPTGIFSTRGSQKQDGASGPNMAVQKYAHKECGHAKPQKRDNMLKGG